MFKAINAPPPAVCQDGTVIIPWIYCSHVWARLDLNLGRVVEMIGQYNPQAFYSVESVRSYGGGVLPPVTQGGSWLMSGLRWTRRRSEK